MVGGNDDLMSTGTIPVEFGNLLNFRDVGQAINQNVRTNILRERRLFRSARPDDASANDRRRLTEHYGIKTVIDLRSKTEHINATKKHNTAVATPAVVPQSKEAIAEAIKLPNVNYHAINVNGSTFERGLLWQLSWSDIGKVCYRMAVGRRNEAISILGQKVMTPRGLTGLACDTLKYSTEEFHDAFDVLSDSSKYPVLIHCTQGKDRTGLLVLLILLLLDVEERSISADYLRSETELLPEKEERVRELQDMGLTEEFARCPTDFVPKVKAFIEEKYGGVGQYLSQAGVAEEKQRNVVEILREF